MDDDYGRWQKIQGLKEREIGLISEKVGGKRKKGIQNKKLIDMPY